MRIGRINWTGTQRRASGQSSPRNYGPDVGEPPLFRDPRRWGSLVALAGGLAFIGYTPPLGPIASTVAWTAGISLVLVALWAHYVHPVPLGPSAHPRPQALAAYAGSVIAELGLIAVGSRTLAAWDHNDLRSALIATVVGLHFFPFSWAFRERMFLWLGGIIAALGAVGLGAGVLGLPDAPQAMAALAGLVMLAISTLYARGRFATSLTLKSPSQDGRSAV